MTSLAPTATTTSTDSPKRIIPSAAPIRPAPNYEVHEAITSALFNIVSCQREIDTPAEDAPQCVLAAYAAYNEGITNALHALAQGIMAECDE